MRRGVLRIAPLRRGLCRRARLLRHSRRCGFARVRRVYSRVRFYSAVARVRAFGVRRDIRSRAVFFAQEERKKTDIRGGVRAVAIFARCPKRKARLSRRARMGSYGSRLVCGGGVLSRARFGAAHALQIFGNRTCLRRNTAHLRVGGTFAHERGRV